MHGNFNTHNLYEAFIERFTIQSDQINHRFHKNHILIVINLNFLYQSLKVLSDL